MQPKLYKEITLKYKQKNYSKNNLSKTYRGISTVANNGKSIILYDLQLIKQDIINHFHIRQGEKLSDPSFGTILWDILHEPLNARTRDLIVNNVTRIINNDPRVKTDKVLVDAYETGISVECTLVYLPYNLKESMKLAFDQNAGFLFNG